MIAGEYYAATNAEGPYHFGPFDTKEACIQDARTEFADEILEGSNIHIGESRTVYIHVDGDSVLDMVANDSYDDLYEYALESWCSEVSSDAKAELGKRLTEVLHKWLDEQNETYAFTCIDPIEEVK